MMAKRSFDTGMTPSGAARGSGTDATSPRRSAQPGSTGPSPIVCSVMASPRACRIHAPLRTTGGQRPLTGATEIISCVGEGTDVLASTRTIGVFGGKAQDVPFQRASDLLAAPRSFGRRHGARDGAADCADGVRGDGFAREGGSTGKMRDSEEVVPWLSTAVGTERTRDVLKDSGTDDWAGPGAFFPVLDRSGEIAEETNLGSETRGFWLLNGGFSGGRQTHLKALCEIRGR